MRNKECINKDSHLKLKRNIHEERDIVANDRVPYPLKNGARGSGARSILN